MRLSSSATDSICIGPRECLPTTGSWLTPRLRRTVPSKQPLRSVSGTVCVKWCFFRLIAGSIFRSTSGRDANVRQEIEVARRVELNPLDAFIGDANHIHIEQADVGKFFSHDVLDLAVGLFSLFDVDFSTCKLDQPIDAWVRVMASIR